MDSIANQRKEPLLSKEEADSEEEPSKYQATPLRWGILFSLASIKFSQGIVQGGFAPIAV